MLTRPARLPHPWGASAAPVRQLLHLLFFTSHPTGSGFSQCACYAGAVEFLATLGCPWWFDTLTAHTVAQNNAIPSSPKRIHLPEGQSRPAGLDEVRVFDTRE